MRESWCRLYQEQGSLQSACSIRAGPTSTSHVPPLMLASSHLRSGGFSNTCPRRGHVTSVMLVMQGLSSRCVGPQFSHLESGMYWYPLKSPVEG